MPSSLTLATCPVCGSCESLNENEARSIKLENARLRREYPETALSSEARIISLEEKLALVERTRHRQMQEMEIIHAQSLNLVVHSLEDDLASATAQRDAALLQVAELTARLEVAEQRLARETLLRMAGEVHEIESQLLFDEGAMASPAEPLSEQLSPTNSSSSANDDGASRRSGSLRRAFRKSKEAVRLTLPRRDLTPEASGLVATVSRAESWSSGRRLSKPSTEGDL